MEWTDATSYSRGDNERKQSAWELKLPSLRIWVGNKHKDYPGEFIMHCFELGIDTMRLNLKADCQIDLVKEKAWRICKTKAEKIIFELLQSY